MTSPNVLNVIEPPDKTGNNVFNLGGGVKTGGGASLKDITKIIMASNASGNSVANDFAYLPIHDAGVVTEFTAVLSGAGTGGGETLIISLGVLGTPDRAIATSTITFNQNSPDGIRATVVPTGTEAAVTQGEVITLHVLGTKPTNWAISCSVKVALS